MLCCVFCDDVTFVFYITRHVVRGEENLALVGIRTRTVQPVTRRHIGWATTASWRNGQKNVLRKEIISWMDRETAVFCVKTMVIPLRFKSEVLLERNCVWDKLLDKSQRNMESMAKHGAKKHKIYVIILLFCTVNQQMHTIISPIITLLHVSTLSRHPQGALATIMKHVTQIDTHSNSVHTGQHNSSINIQIVYAATTHTDCMPIVTTKWF
jgi:hypothetical protein